MQTFDDFRREIERTLFRHPVITANPYTEWFARGEACEEQVRDLIVQFSVFSNHFLVVQLKRMVNASTLEGEECARNILMSECGVAINPATGSPEGKTFATRNAHLNWLREIGEKLGLGPMELGRWKSGSEATKRFLKGLEASYGSLDGEIGAGASFAIENWAAFGIGQGAERESRNFWKQLIVGLKGVNRERVRRGEEPLPLGFFLFHFHLEAGHGASVWKELEHSFRQPGFNARKFLKGGRQALNAIETFWLGLDDARRRVRRPPEAVFESINIAQWAF